MKPLTTLPPLQALNLIGGSWQDAAGARRGDSVDPASGRDIGTFAASGRNDARQALAAARSAFQHSAWAVDPALRRTLLLQWAERLARRADLTQLLTLENGKVLAQARREIEGAVAELRRAAEATRPAAAPPHGGRDRHAAKAAGVAALILPWNAPVRMLMRLLAPALSAGCTAVIRPPAQAAQISAVLLRELQALPGLPPGVVNLVSETGHDVEQELLASAEVDAIAFAGSYEAGRKIALAAAAGTQRLSLHLSGRECCLVFADADVGALAPRLAAAATAISGQHCVAAHRILVHASRYEELKLALKAALARVVVGAGDAPRVAMGPLIDAAALLSVGIRTEQALAAGDEVVLRGGRVGGKLAGGFFLAPTLVGQRAGKAWLGQEAIFGPIVLLQQFGDDAEAVAAAAAAPGPLLVRLWSADAQRADRAAMALRNATVWINDGRRLRAEAEQGGYRQQGGGPLRSLAARRRIHRDAEKRQ